MSLPSLAPNQNNDPSIPVLDIEIKTFKNDTLISKFNPNCLTANFLQNIYIKGGNGNTTVLPSGSPFNDSVSLVNNTGGLTDSANYPGFIFAVLQWGTSNQPFSLLDTHTINSIDDGTATGQFSYDIYPDIPGQVIGTKVTFLQGVVTANNTSSFILTESATNNSGAVINVNEIGLYGVINTYFFYILRAVYPSAISINNLDVIKSTIAFTINI